MIPTVKLVLVLATALAVLVTTIDASNNKGKNTGNQNNVNDKLERELREAAQQALDAIGSTRVLSACDKLANRGQHVFNNGLLKIHRNVLEDLLKDLGGFDQQMENLVNILVSPLSQTQREAISTMVVNFSEKDSYVDYNACVYGEYVMKLRKALVAFLKAETSDNKDEKNKIQHEQNNVESITHLMVQHEVYVDPMARDRWLQENKKEVQNREKIYNEVRGALQNMFQNILQNFQAVSVKIRDFRRRNNWNR